MGVFLMPFVTFSQNVAWFDMNGNTNYGSIKCSAIYNGELYVGGSFSSIGGVNATGFAKKSGISWVAVGNASLGVINSMMVYNNELYVGGSFSVPGGSSYNRIAKWNGTSWSVVGTGITSTNTAVYSMEVYNGELYVAGDFTTAGGVTVNHIAKWNGTNWAAVGAATINGDVYSMTVYNNELYVGGSFSSPANNIARWNGISWNTAGLGVINSGGYGGEVRSMIVYNNELYVGGAFNKADGINGIFVGLGPAKWNGTAWSQVGDRGTDGGTIFSMAIYNNELYFGGSIDDLYIFNPFSTVPTNSMAKWDGTSWNAFDVCYCPGAPNSSSINPNHPNIYTMVLFDDQLILGGDFTGTTGSLSSINYNNLIALKATEPTPANPSSNLTFSNLTDSSVTLNWLVGSGTKRVVVAKKDTAVNFTPVDGYEYIANNNYGSGTTLSYMSGPNYAIYTGSGNSATVTGLDPGHTYYFSVFEYDTSTNVATALNYLTGTGNVLTGSKLILAAEPTVSASNVVISTIGQTSLTLNFTNGDGAKRLVVAKAGAAVNAVPIDTQTYIANTIFGSGYDFGNGNYAVYNGTSNTFTVTGLTPDVIYHFSIFEYNDEGYSGLENYFTTGVTSANHTTIATEPTVSSSTFSFTNVSLTDMTVSLSAGNGSRRLVLAKQSSFVNGIPVDTMAYSANGIFGSGAVIGNGNYVVYDGTGTSFNLSGLTANAKYYFASYEYNGSTTAANNYFLITPATAMQGALNSEPTLQPTSIVFTNVTDNSMTLSWTNGDGANRIVIARTAAVNAAPEDAIEYNANAVFAQGDNLGLNNYVVYTGSSNTFDLSGLTPNTTYYFAIYEYNGENTSNNYFTLSSATAFKSTLFAEPLSAATNLTLSPITNGITTVSWTNGTGSNRVVVVREGLPLNELPDDGNGYIANSTFALGDNLGSANYICFNGNTTSFNLQGLDPTHVYYVGVLEYNGSGTSANYLTSTFPIASNLPSEPTVAASALTITQNSSSSANVHWTNGNGQYRILIVKAGAAEDEIPVDGTVYTANTAYSSGAQLGVGNFVVYTGTANNTVVTNLDPNVTYYFALFEFNKDQVGPPNYLETPNLTGTYTNINVGVKEIKDESVVAVYPNPTTGKIYINVKNGNRKADVELYNLLGKKVLESKNTVELDLSDFNRGVYLMKIYDGTNCYTKRIHLQ